MSLAWTVLSENLVLSYFCRKDCLTFMVEVRILNEAYPEASLKSSSRS